MNLLFNFTCIFVIINFFFIIKYTQSSTFWSVGGVRQQFSLVENIRMSLFTSKFLREAKENLKIEDGK